jgi:hypothetical protein
VIADYIPDIQARLNAIIADLEANQEILLTANQGRSSPEVLLLPDGHRQHALSGRRSGTRSLQFMNRFSEGSGSAAQLLGIALASAAEPAAGAGQGPTFTRPT